MTQFSHKILKPCNSVRTLDTDYAAILLGWNVNSYDMFKLLSRRGITVAVVSTPSTLERSILGKNAYDNEAARNAANELADYLNAQVLSGTNAVIIPSEDIYAIFLAHAVNKLHSRFACQTIPPALVRQCTSKVEFHRLCQRLDIDSPKTFLLDCEESISELRAQLPYPGIAKPHYSGALPKTIIPKILKINNECELISLAHKVWATGQPLFYQEYIPGPSSMTWFVGGLFHRPFEDSQYFVGRKLQEDPLLGGSTTYAVLEWNQEVFDIAKKFILQFDFQGLVDIELKYDVRDRRYKIIEVNPRIGYWHSISDTGKTDIITLFFAHNAGLPIKAENMQQNGRRWISPHVALCGFVELNGLIPGLVRWLWALLRSDIKAGVDLKDRVRTVQQAKVTLGHIRRLSLKTLLLGSRPNF